MVEHVERWYLWRGVERPETEREVEERVRPVTERIRQAERQTP
jgi:hypothetical protein